MNSIRSLGRDIESPRLLSLKGLLFLVAAVMSGGILLADSPSFRTATLLLLCTGCACRFYYFAFYVIERYADPSYRFAGLLDFAVYLWKRRGVPGPEPGALIAPPTEVRRDPSKGSPDGQGSDGTSAE